MVCQSSFTSWCPEPNQTGLKAGGFHGPARVPPSPCPLAGEGRLGLAFMELNEWRNQNLNRPYCATASKGAVAWQGLWSWGKHRRGKGLVSGDSPAHKLIKRHQHTGVRTYSVSVRTQVYCVRTITLSRACTCCPTKNMQRCSLWCLPVFVPEAKSHSV